MKKFFGFITVIAFTALIFASPVIMDHARDVYLEEVVSPKAMPVKIGDRIVASSFQIRWKGKRVTVTNNHVCSIVETIARRKAARAHIQRIRFIRSRKLPKELEKKLIILSQIVLDSSSYPIVGETLRIGDVNRKILYNSPNHDICFLEPVGAKSFTLAGSVHRGERITIIGHPRGVAQSMADGRIVGEAYYKFPWIAKAGKVRYLRSTAITYPGNSGSPVINRYGNVVGILFAGRSINSLNINCVVPFEYIESDLNSYFNAK